MTVTENQRRNIDTTSTGLVREAREPPEVPDRPQRRRATSGLPAGSPHRVTASSATALAAMTGQPHPLPNRDPTRLHSPHPTPPARHATTTCGTASASTHAVSP